MPSFPFLDLTKVTTAQRDAVMNAMNIGFPDGIDDIERGMYDRFFTLMMDCLIHEVYSISHIQDYFQQFQKASQADRMGALRMHNKRVQQAIDKQETADIEYGEDMAIDEVQKVMRNLQPSERPAFLYILVNGVQPPANFSQDVPAFQKYFNTLLPEEIPSVEAQQRLQAVMAQQARLNSANPGYNRPITPQGFAQMVQPAQSTTRNQQPPQLSNPQPQNTTPAHTQKPQVQSKQRVKIKPRQNQAAQTQPQPSQRNKSLEDLLGS